MKSVKIISSSGLLTRPIMIHGPIFIHAVPSNFSHTRIRHKHAQALSVPVHEVFFENRMMDMKWIWCMWKGWHTMGHARIWSQKVRDTVWQLFWTVTDLYILMHENLEHQELQSTSINMPKTPKVFFLCMFLIIVQFLLLLSRSIVPHC